MIRPPFDTAGTVAAVEAAAVIITSPAYCPEISTLEIRAAARAEAAAILEPFLTPSPAHFGATLDVVATLAGFMFRAAVGEQAADEGTFGFDLNTGGEDHPGAHVGVRMAIAAAMRDRAMLLAHTRVALSFEDSDDLADVIDGLFEALHIAGHHTVEVI